MKIINIKLYYLNDEYSLIIKYIRMKDKARIIDNTLNKQFKDFDDVKSFFLEYIPIREYTKSKLCITYISCECFVEMISLLNEGNIKTLSQNVLDNLYPDYRSIYNVNYSTCVLKNKQKNALYTFVTINNKIDKLIHLTRSNRCTIYHDLIITDKYFKKNIQYFKSKYIFMILIEGEFYRFIEVLYGSIINYYVASVIYDKNVIDNLFSIVDRKYDEIIIDCEFKDYKTFIDRWPSLRVLYAESIDKLRYIDEYKVCNV